MYVICKGKQLPCDEASLRNQMGLMIGKSLHNDPEVAAKGNPKPRKDRQFPRVHKNGYKKRHSNIQDHTYGPGASRVPTLEWCCTINPKVEAENEVRRMRCEGCGSARMPYKRHEKKVCEECLLYSVPKHLRFGLINPSPSSTGLSEDLSEIL